VKPRIFLTGGSGALGSRLLRRLEEGGAEVAALFRGGPDSEWGSRSGTVKIVRGDLLNASSYQAALGGCSSVVHLAAATGNASAREHFRTNAEGTRILLDACRRAGKPAFLYVSSIAVNFPRRVCYPYAESKREAEAAVRSSGLKFTIVRPTLICGAGSGSLEGLRKLASGSVIPVPGNGQVRMQPIHVDDLAGLIAGIVRERRFAGSTLELGGPDVLTLDALLRELHACLRGDSESGGRCMHVPLVPIRMALTLAERMLPGRLPVTSGQLASFRFDGTARSNPLFERHRGELKGVREMLRMSVTP